MMTLLMLGDRPRGGATYLARREPVARVSTPHLLLFESSQNYFLMLLVICYLGLILQSLQLACRGVWRPVEF